MGASIGKLVQGACDRIPFYRDHLAKVATGVSTLAELPTFEKSKTAQYGRFPLSAGGAAGAYRVLATSGTSGDRLYVSFDHDEWNRTADWLGKVARRVGLSSTDVLLNTHCYGLWVGGPALDLLANRAEAGLVPLGPTSPSLVLQLLGDGVGTSISATPSYMRRVVEAAEEAKFDLADTSLRLGFIGAEMAEESLRRKLLARLPKGFVWIELYGLTETGGPAVAFAPDPLVPELEVNTDEFYLEILDVSADRPVPLGEVGEITITTRRVDGRTPLIRYRTRDLARATAGDANTATRISRILGRADDSLKVDGVLLYPTAIAEIMSDLVPATAEWRASIRSRHPDNELCVEAEVSADHCRRVERAFRERIGLALNVIPVEAGSLARSTHKTQRTRRVLIESSSPVEGPSPREPASMLREEA